MIPQGLKHSRSPAGLNEEQKTFIKPFALSVKAVVVNEAGESLWLKRSVESKGNPGKWDLPGGKVDAGESFDKALIRETTEETGLKIGLIRMLKAVEVELSARKIVYLVMLAAPVSGKIKLSEEHDDFSWIAPADLNESMIVPQFRGIISNIRLEF